MKRLNISATLFLGLASSIVVVVAQYGIPDDDDQPPVRVPLKFSPQPHVFQDPTTQAPSYQMPQEYETKFEVPSYAELPDLKIALEPIHFEVREQKVSNLDYQKPPQSPPAIAVRSTEKPSHSYELPAQKIIFKDSNPSSSIYSNPTPNVVRVETRKPVVIVKDSYSRQQVFSSDLNKEAVPIVKYVMEDDALGNYRLETLTADGIVTTGSGRLKNLGGKEGPVQIMSGSYSFTSDDGKVYKTDWTADELGFNAKGEHIP